MTYIEAVTIIEHINTDYYSDEEKLSAIKMIASVKTKRLLTKDNLKDAIMYLLNTRSDCTEN